MTLFGKILRLLVPLLEKKHKDRKFILDMVPKSAICAEIGVWKGDFSKQILETVKPKKLHLIDPWKFTPEYKDRWYGGTIAKNQKDMDGIYEGVKKAFKNDNRVVIHKSFSHEIVRKFRDNYFDFVYVDGNHSYEYVKRDLENFFPKVKKGGIMAGDDYISFWSLLNRFAVKRAVDEFVKKHNLKKRSAKGQFVIHK